LKNAKVPLHFGTLVVFTDGTDRASRVPLQQTLDAVNASEDSVFAIGVGNEIDDATLSRIGKDGYIRVENTATLQDAFKQIGDRIVRYTRRYYLLSYCSPARAGKHTVTVEAVTKKSRGKVSYAFDAQGFGPGCDATKPPPFDTTGRSLRSRQKMGLIPEPQQHASKPAPKPAVAPKVAAAPKPEVKAEASAGATVSGGTGAAAGTSAEAK
jgi:hypothetical protein